MLELIASLLLLGGLLIAAAHFALWRIEARAQRRASEMAARAFERAKEEMRHG